MTNPTNPNPTNPTPTSPGRDRPARPTVREIAALTARLRELSAHGAGADPAARAAFLADKHALLDRITAGLPDTPAPAGIARPEARRRRAEPARPDDPAELAARAAALRDRAHSANARTEAPAAGRPELHQHRPALNRVRPQLGLPDDGADDGFSSWTGPRDAYPFGADDHAPDGLDQADVDQPDAHRYPGIHDYHDLLDENADPAVSAPRWQADARSADPDEPVVLFDPADAYTDAENTAIDQALTRGDPAEARRLMGIDDLDDDSVELTGAMVEQAHRAAASLPEPRPGSSGEPGRREQLAAWHAADQADEQAAEDCAPDDTRTVPGSDPGVVREW